jgi:hypothetical protein
MASVLCTIGMLLYIPIVMYVPALALSHGKLFYVVFVSINTIFLDSLNLIYISKQFILTKVLRKKF